jgi:hypothetical protein
MFEATLLRRRVATAAFLLSGAICLMAVPAAAQTMLFEIQAPVVENTRPYTFQVLGDRDAGSFSAYGIQVIGPDGKTQMLDDFESILPDNSEADALVVEDVNFDGYADLRLMEYLPGGSADVPFFYWLYQPSSGTFLANEAFREVLSPEVDQDDRQLISRQKKSSTEFLTQYYEPQGEVPVLVRQEVRTYAPDGSSKIHVFAIKGDAAPQLVETRQLGPGE